MTPKRPRVFLLDGLALAYRSHFAFIRRPLLNKRSFRGSKALPPLKELPPKKGASA